MRTRPIAEGLFTEGQAPYLFGGRHRQTGRIVFPCPDGLEGAQYETVKLGRSGTLWSWTIQRFPPKSPPYAGPKAFEPFAMGYVELPGETIVVARLTGVDFDALQVGQAMTMTTLPFATDPDGTTVLTYAFAPTDEPVA